jgi:dihydroorotate dehydrogenase
VAAADQVRSRRTRRQVVGISIGKTKAVPKAWVAADYSASAESLARGPGLPGGKRQLTEHAGAALPPSYGALASLPTMVREALDAASPSGPVAGKVAPDLAGEEIDVMVDLAVELGVDGIIAPTRRSPVTIWPATRLGPCAESPCRGRDWTSG